MRFVVVLLITTGLLGGIDRVAAADAGFYVSLGAGRADYTGDIGRQVREAYASQPNYEVLSAGLADSSDGAWKAAAGYRFLPWLAFELGWNDNGGAISRYSVKSLLSPTSPGTGTIRGTYQLSGPSAAVVAELPINEAFGIALRAGAVDAKLEYEEAGTDIAGKPYQFHGPDDTHTVPFAGLGAIWHLDPTWELHLEWDRWFGIGTRFDLTETTNGRFDHVDLYTLNITYRFGD